MIGPAGTFQAPKQQPSDRGHLLVDTATGLRIVKANEKNFFNIKYAVQLVGTYAECEREKGRLNKM